MDDVSSVARELRAARENLGLTREQLAEKIGYTASYTEKIERGLLPATEPFIAAAAKKLGAGTDPVALFTRLRSDEKREVVPEWFRPWVDHEQTATEIRGYEPLLVPGLLQTERYATDLLGDPERVQARLERQTVLDRVSLTVIISERVLTYRVGDREVMAEQLRHLTETPAKVHVLPDDADTHLGTLGAFAIARVDGSDVGYTDTPARGYLAPEPEVASDLERRWRGLLAESLPRSLSQALIMKEAGRWKDRA